MRSTVGSEVAVKVIDIFRNDKDDTRFGELR